MRTSTGLNRRSRGKQRWWPITGAAPITTNAAGTLNLVITGAGSITYNLNAGVVTRPYGTPTMEPFFDHLIYANISRIVGINLLGVVNGTAAVLPALERAMGVGTSIIEVGIPFSDPIADGPIIAAAMHRALQLGATPLEVFDQVASVRASLSIGLIAMCSMSIATGSAST